MRNRAILKLILFLIYLLLGTFVYIFSFRYLELGSNKNLLVGEISLLLLICIVFVYLIKIVNAKYFKKIFNYQDLIIYFLILFFFNYNFYGFIPFNASRSNTVIIMDYLNSQNTVPVSKDSILEHTNNVYFYEYDAIQKRLEEQIAIGNVITFVNTAPDGSNTFTISPNASDGILYAGSLTDDKDLINTKATSKVGDFVKLASLNSTAHWTVVDAQGTWAKES